MGAGGERTSCGGQERMWGGLPITHTQVAIPVRRSQERVRGPCWGQQGPGPGVCIGAARGCSGVNEVLHNRHTHSGDHSPVGVALGSHSMWRSGSCRHVGGVTLSSERMHSWRWQHKGTRRGGGGAEGAGAVVVGGRAWSGSRGGMSTSWHARCRASVAAGVQVSRQVGHGGLELWEWRCATHPRWRGCSHCGQRNALAGPVARSSTGQRQTAQAGASSSTTGGREG